MKALLAAVAMSIVLPSVAHAQIAPTPPVKEDCCERMKAEGKKCCCCDDTDKQDKAPRDVEGHPIMDDDVE